MKVLFFTLAITISISYQEAGPIHQEHPCTSISGTTIAQILGWEGANDATPTTMRDGRLQSCYFNASDNIGAATITISQSSEKTVERKGLERSFSTDLANEGRLTYETVSLGLGDQAIYGYGKRGPSHIYKLRWRVGNQTDYSIDATFYEKQKKEEVLDQIRKLADLL